ncbi:DUF4391 domain-containing protein [Algiphilus sp. W345]|uniref:DUF4391 domain-containing protein n=1 Tax=Banduia mediterranea TaxID=3075609 RepID=A0ABU2WD38_9GAMM|nr:DUF4391 domain-containing protein [Algiphilus sp. W345]MDT0495787.1 DUF4391 domain-containing protein [Algiphilus sp. W345]
MIGAPYSYPAKASFGRIIPKNRIYEHGRLGKALRERIKAQVDRITWAAKLAPETTNLPEAQGVQEIQIIELTQRDNDLDTSVLLAIDRAIPKPTLFHLRYRGQVRMAAAYKRPSEADRSKWVIGEHYLGDWYPENGDRQALPIALDLQGLYEQLLRGLLPHPARPGESIAAHLERVEAIRRHERERARLDAKLQREKQFNRKVALNAQLRTVNQHIETLTA